MTRMLAHDFQQFRRTKDSRWITATVAALAIVVFTISGSQILPELVSHSSTGDKVTNGQLTAFLLNIALLLFAWRRSSQLLETFKERDAAELRARELAYVDEVTGLYNRRYLKEAFNSLHSRPNARSALLLIDLDRFKSVNDLHGHEVGDELLVVATKRILKLCPDQAICTRLGGDEFAILYPDFFDRERDVKALATQLIIELGRPFYASGNQLNIGASIGLSGSSADGDDLSALLNRADAAMYEAKRLGGSCFVEFDVAMAEEVLQRKMLEAEMRAGLSEGEFVPYFQPIIDLVSRDVAGFEVLARWKHPTRGVLEPADFIDVAEACGLMNELSLSVMKQALTIAREWPQRLRLSINISPIQFRDEFLAPRIFDVLEETGFPAKRLDLEIAESSLIADRAFALSTIQVLKARGLGVVVDDFATGYASLAQMEALPFDRLKIDKSFLERLEEGNKCDAIIQAIAALGKGLSVPVSAEGVESETLQNKLIELGCGKAQGWLYAKALSADQVDIALQNEPQSSSLDGLEPHSIAQAS